MRPVNVMLVCRVKTATKAGIVLQKIEGPEQAFHI